MFCFQSPFTRTSRGPVTSQSVIPSVVHHETSSANVSSTTSTTTTTTTTTNVVNGSDTMRRGSEAVSEGSGTSSIQFIDQEVSLSTSSSTDTLPGIRADYLDADPFSPSSAPLATLDIIPVTQINGVCHVNGDEKSLLSKATTPMSLQKRRNGRWRKKLLLSLCSETANSNGDTTKNLTSIRLPKTSSFMTRQDNDTKKGVVGIGLKARSTNDLPSLNASSDDDEEEEEEEEDDDDDDDEEEDEVVVEEDEFDVDDGETETEDGSSLPSSPAATLSVGLAPVQVPYYSFLSVNGGAMRQETTSTSSPQLSTSIDIDNKLTALEIVETSSITDDLTPVGMSLIKKPENLDTPSGLPAARSCPNLEQQSTACSSTSESSSHSPSPGFAGPRFKPLQEGDIQVCYLNHTRTLVSKILSSKFLRRWETHHLYLNDACLSSKTPTGFLQQPVHYSSMTEVYTVARWDPTYKYCLRIVLPDGSLLLQASNAYTRDQWYHSILWKKSIFRYQHTVSANTNEDIILRELKSLVDFALWTPLQDERINGAPLEAVAKLLGASTDEKDVKKSMEHEDIRRCWVESVFGVVAPLLEKVAPPPVLARVLAKLVQKYPQSSFVPALTHAITRCLKHTVDFGKCPGMRKLIQSWIAASYDHDDGEQYIRDYIRSIHGPGSDCPHPRILPNLASICVAAIFHRFDTIERRLVDENGQPIVPPLQCFLLVLEIVSEYADWRPGLSALIQPIPFPPEALCNQDVQDSLMLKVMRRLTRDPRCAVHRLLLPVREIRPGWIHITAPPNPTCPDDGTLFAEMLTSLLKCCCRRKKFVTSLMKQTGSACILLALRDCTAAQEALSLMLEWRLLTNEESRNQVISTLQSTESGREFHSALCQRQKNLQELQQKGGPKKLSLPTRATDADVAQLLGGGALGNLECLSLAFTSVTSACAEQLIKLPALRYLNLWATQFGDAGLQMISEHLQKLQVLNLCETPVSDKGISTLVSLTSLRKLNLNSTNISAQTFESLKKRLPALQELDVRYTEAW